MVRRTVGGLAELTDRRRCGEQGGHPVALDDLPGPVPGRGVQRALAHHRRPPGAQRPQHALGDPVDERQLHGRPQHFVVGPAEDAPVELGGADQEPGGGQHDAEWLMPVAAEVLHEQRMIRFDGQTAPSSPPAAAASARRSPYQWSPSNQSTGLPVRRTTTVACTASGSVSVASASSARSLSGTSTPWRHVPSCVTSTWAAEGRQPVGQRLSGEGHRNEARHGSDPGTGQDGHDRFGNPAHVQRDTVAPADPQARAARRRRPAPGVQLGIGDRAAIAGFPLPMEWPAGRPGPRRCRSTQLTAALSCHRRTSARFGRAARTARSTGGPRPGSRPPRTSGPAPLRCH